MATTRKEKNTIHGLYDQAGVWREEDWDIEGVIMNYFGELFQTANPSDALMMRCWRMWSACDFGDEYPACCAFFFR